MAEYRYTDRDGDELRIVRDESDLFVTVRQGSYTTTVDVPHNEAPSLARAVLAATGDTGHRVIKVCSSRSTFMDGVTWHCEQSHDHTGMHQSAGGDRQWTDSVSDPAPALCAAPRPRGHDPADGPAPDFRVHLLAEILGEDEQDAADLLTEDPAAAWEKAYAVWRLESAESPVLDRIAQLERDMGRTEQGLATLGGTVGKTLHRLDALELQARERTQSAGAARATVQGGGFAESRHAPAWPRPNP